MANDLELIEWTPILEKARIDLCEWFVELAHDPVGVRPLLARKAIEAEQALTILGEIAKTSAAAIIRLTEEVAGLRARTQELWTERGQILQDAGFAELRLIADREAAEARVAALEGAIRSARSISIYGHNREKLRDILDAALAQTGSKP